MRKLPMRIRLRILANKIRCKIGIHLWSEATMYENELGNLPKANKQRKIKVRPFDAKNVIPIKFCRLCDKIKKI